MITLQQKGIDVVMKYEKKQKRFPIDVHNDKNYAGMDLLSIDLKKEQKPRLIEVKASNRPSSIPDAYISEFTAKLKLRATHLYVVNFVNGKPILAIFPKKEVDKYKHTVFEHVRFSNTLKTNIEKFRVKL
jgi:hypothetical protein